MLAQISAALVSFAIFFLAARLVLFVATIATVTYQWIHNLLLRH